MAAWSMMRWHNSGQSCIRPSMAFLPSFIGPSSQMVAPRLARIKAGATVKNTGVLRRGMRRSLGKTPDTEARNVVRRCFARSEIGENFADDRGELEAMAGAGRGDDDLRMLRQPVEDEIAIRRHGVEARRCPAQCPIGRRQVLGDGLPHR